MATEAGTDSPARRRRARVARATKSVAAKTWASKAGPRGARHPDRVHADGADRPVAGTGGPDARLPPRDPRRAELRALARHRRQRPRRALRVPPRLAQISMLVGFVRRASSRRVIGAVVGICAGYYGGWVDRVLTAIDDWFLVIPFMPSRSSWPPLLGDARRRSGRGGRVTLLIIVIGILGWAGTSRIVRSQVLSVKERQFVERAKALGASPRWIMRQHILPNVLPLVFANTVLIVVAVHPRRVDALVPRPRRPDAVLVGHDARRRATTRAPIGHGAVVVLPAARHRHHARGAAASPGRPRRSRTSSTRACGSAADERRPRRRAGCSTVDAA